MLHVDSLPQGQDLDLSWSWLGSCSITWGSPPSFPLNDPMNLQPLLPTSVVCIVCPALSSPLDAGAAPTIPGTVHTLQGSLLPQVLPPCAVAPIPGASPGAMPHLSPSICVADPGHPVNLWVEWPVPPHQFPVHPLLLPQFQIPLAFPISSYRRSFSYIFLFFFL